MALTFCGKKSEVGASVWPMDTFLVYWHLILLNTFLFQFDKNINLIELWDIEADNYHNCIFQLKIYFTKFLLYYEHSQLKTSYSHTKQMANNDY